MGWISDQYNKLKNWVSGEETSIGNTYSQAAKTAKNVGTDVANAGSGALHFIEHPVDTTTAGILAVEGYGQKLLNQGTQAIEKSVEKKAETALNGMTGGLFGKLISPGGDSGANGQGDNAPDDNSFGLDFLGLGNLIKAIVKIFEALFAFVGAILSGGGLMSGVASLFSGNDSGASGGNKFTHWVSNTWSKTWNNADQFVGTKVLGFKAPEATKAMVDAAATKYHIDPADMLTLTKIESGWNPNAVNAQSGATGLVQFMKGTADKFGRWWDRKDPVQSLEYGCQLWNSNSEILEHGLGRAPTPGEKYMAWQQGPAETLALLNPANQGKPAWQAIAPIYEKKYGVDKGQEIAKKAVTGNGGGLDMTAAQFATRWTNEFDRDYALVKKENYSVGDGGRESQQLAANRPSTEPAANTPHPPYRQALAMTGSGPSIPVASSPAPGNGSRKPKSNDHDPGGPETA